MFFFFFNAGNIINNSLRITPVSRMRKEVISLFVVKKTKLTKEKEMVGGNLRFIHVKRLSLSLD